MTSRRRPAGFTLIELMVTVAIIGIIASMAFPLAQSAIFRTRSAERFLALKTIKRGIDDFFLQNDALPAAYGGMMEGAATPPLPPVTYRRPPNWRQPGWQDIFAAAGGVGPDLEGELYYSYYFLVVETPAGPVAVIQALGDVDGDGIVAVRSATYQRTGGVFQTRPEWQVPPGWTDKNIEDGVW